MDHLKEDTSFAPSCDALLVQVIGIYLEIDALYQSMHNDLSAPSVLQVTQTLEILNALLQDAQTTDHQIAKSLNNHSGVSETNIALVGKRAEILKRLFQNNESIINRAENMKSLLRHEIASISTSHNAIKGYKPAGEERTHIIRNSF